MFVSQTFREPTQHMLAAGQTSRIPLNILKPNDGAKIIFLLPTIYTLDIVTEMLPVIRMISQICNN